MKNIIKGIVLSLSFFFLFGITSVYAGGLANVIEVLDADAITVMYNSGMMKNVKIKDVSLDKSPEAYQYAIQNLLGQQIYVIDEVAPSSVVIPSGWEYARIRYGINKGIYEYNIKRYDESNYKEEQLTARERSYWNSRAININTATLSELSDIPKLTSSQARKIKEYREDDKYSYRTLEELLYIPNINLSYANLQDLEIYAHLYTDLNKASGNELLSLLGKSSLSQRQKERMVDDIISNRPFKSIREARKYIGDNYDKIEELIYVDTLVQSPAININTAHYTDMQSFLGLKEDVARGIYKHQGKYSTIKNINTKTYASILNKISLYTNINTASKRELMLLSTDMDNNMADLIIEYRNRQGFKNQKEIREFFDKYNQSFLYNQISDYITTM